MNQFFLQNESSVKLFFLIHIKLNSEEKHTDYIA